MGLTGFLRNAWAAAGAVLGLTALGWGCLMLADATGQPAWIGLIAVPAVLGLAALGTSAGNLTGVLCALLLVYGGLRLEVMDERLGVWFAMVVLALAWVLVGWHRVQLERRVRDHADASATQSERLILAREQYKNDLVAKVSTEKKIDKYARFRRISRLFGYILDLNDLAY